MLVRLNLKTKPGLENVLSTFYCLSRHLGWKSLHIIRNFRKPYSWWFVMVWRCLHLSVSCNPIQPCVIYFRRVDTLTNHLQRVDLEDILFRRKLRSWWLNVEQQTYYEHLQKWDSGGLVPTLKLYVTLLSLVINSWWNCSLNWIMSYSSDNPIISENLQLLKGSSKC